MAASSMHEACVRVYVASVYEDSVCERGVLKRTVFPRVSEWAANRGVQLYFVDRASLMSRSLPNVPAALHELDRSSIVLGLFGGKCGKPLKEIPLDSEHVAKLNDYPQFAWMKGSDGRTAYGASSLFEYEISRALAQPDKGGRPIEGALSLMYMRDNSSFIPKDAKTLYSNPNKASFAETPVTCIGTMLDGSYKKIAGQTVFLLDEPRGTKFEILKNQILDEFSGHGSVDSNITSVRSYLPKFVPPKSGEGFRENIPTSDGMFSGLSEFAVQVEHDLKQAILRIFPNEHPMVWPLKALCDITRISEGALLASTCKHAAGLHRSATEEKLLSYLRAEDDTNYSTMGMCILSGRVGIGKTTVSAQVAKIMDDNSRHSDSVKRQPNQKQLGAPVFIHHFIGSCAESMEVKYMLAKLTQDLRKAHAELRHRLYPGMPKPEPQSLHAFDAMPQVSMEFITHEIAIQTFHDALHKTCEAARDVDTHVAMLIDNLDGLSATGGESTKCTWLPDWRQSVIGQDEEHWLHRLKIVVTIKATGKERAGIAERLAKRCHGKGRSLVNISIPGLKRAQKEKLIDSYMAKYERHAPNIEENYGLTPKKRNQLCNKMSSDLPMYLNLVLEELILNPTMDIAKLPHTVTRLMERNIVRTEHVVGRNLAQRVFSVVASSNGGMYEFELSRLLDLPPEALTPAFQCMKPFLRRAFPSQIYRKLSMSSDDIADDQISGIYPSASDLRDERICFSVSDMLDAVQERYFFWKKMPTSQNITSMAKQQVSQDESQSNHEKKSWKGMHRVMATFFRSMCFNAKAKRKKADKAIADALARANGEGNEDLGSALVREADASKGMPWRHHTKAHIRGLQCIGFHLRHGDEKVLLGQTLTDLTYVSACCGASRLYELLEDLKEARRVLLWGRAAQRGWSGLRTALLKAVSKKKGKAQSAVNAEHVQQLREFIHFIESRSTWLTKYPYLISQEAANQPASLFPAVHANKLWSAIIEESAAWAQNAVFFAGAKISQASPSRVGSATGNLIGATGKEGHKEAGKESSDSGNDDNEATPEESNDVEDNSNFKQEETEDSREAKKSVEKEAGIRRRGASNWIYTNEERVERGYRNWIRWVNKPTAPDPCVKTLQGHKGPVTSVTFAPDTEDGYEPNLASSSKDGTVRVWSPMGETISVIRGGRDEYYNVCEFCPEDATLIAVGSSQGAVQIWDAAAAVLRGSILVKAPIKEDLMMTQSAIIPENSAVSSDDSSYDSVTALSWCSQGKLLAIGTEAGNLLVLSYQRLDHSLNIENSWYAHDGAINLAVFGGRSMDGTAYLFSGSAEGQTHLEYRKWKRNGTQDWQITSCLQQYSSHAFINYI